MGRGGGREIVLGARPTGSPVQKLQGRGHHHHYYSLPSSRITKLCLDWSDPECLSRSLFISNLTTVVVHLLRSMSYLSSDVWTGQESILSLSLSRFRFPLIPFGISLDSKGRSRLNLIWNMCCVAFQQQGSNKALQRHRHRNPPEAHPDSRPRTSGGKKKKKKEGLKIKHRKRKCVVTVIDIKADSALISDSPSNSVDDISRK